MATISGTLSKAWMSQAIGVKFDRRYYFDPDRRLEIDRLCNEYARGHFSGMRLFYSESNLGQFDHSGDEQVLIGGIQPNMILAMLLGAEFAAADDRDADVAGYCLKDRGPDELPDVAALRDHPLIKTFDEQIESVRSSSGGRLRAIPPFFWDTSGRAAIHGVMTSAQKLVGETFFMDMLEAPERSLALMQYIASAYISLCLHFSEIAELPITGAHVGECSACMVGPDLIERFVVGVTSQIGRSLGPIRLHSCGDSTRYLRSFANIENLHSIDVGGETSIERAREVFGDLMPLSIAPLPVDMAADDGTALLNWARRVVEDNADGPLEFVYHLEPGYRIENLRALTDFVGDLNRR